MIAVYIVSLLIILAAAGGVCYLFSRNLIDARTDFNAQLDALRLDNRDLRDRLFVKNGVPPPGINVAAAYEERVEATKQPRTRQSKQSLGPIEQQRQEAFAAEAKRISAANN